MMASVADELLNDFEGSGSEDEDNPQENGHESGVDGASSDSDAEMEDADEEEQAKSLGKVSDIKSALSLMRKLEPVLAEIRKFVNKPQSHVGSVEENPEFRLLGQANSLSVSIDGEIVIVHKFIRDHYSIRFPELETLVTNPLDYAKTVAVIGNGPMDNIAGLAASADNILGQPLKSVLDGPSLMAVTIGATSTQGRDMPEAELQSVVSACQMTLRLDGSKGVLTEYVQSRMNIFAPNLTALIGSLTAAQLLNYAGGLTGLAKTPACNVPPLGSKKQAGTGFATNVGVRHQGFLYHSPIIKGIPNDLKKQAMRIVSAKVILAARVDLVHSSPDGTTGEQLREDCLTRLDKLTEPPPNKGVRALPAPDDKPARKRGGRRARRAKEATAMTDLRKAQNRMAFGKEEQEVGYGAGEGTKGLGMIGQGSDGHIRAQQIDQRTKARLSKKNPGWGGGAGTATVGGMASSLRGIGQSGNASVLRGHGLRASGVGSAAASGGGGGGTASTIAFTPVQGLELMDPKVREEMSRKRKADEDRWFKGGTFTQIGGGGSGGQTTTVDAAGFKVPQLPPRKKVDTGAGKG